MAGLALAIGVFASGPVFAQSAAAPAAGSAADTRDAVPAAEIPDVRLRAQGTPVPRIGREREDFARHCQGCHGHEGVSVAEVPRLRDRVGYFAHTVEGRAYMVQVPNVLQARLSDVRLAAMLNWMLGAFSAAQLPRDFRPYDADEIATLRTQRLASVGRRRAEVVQGLVEARVVAHPDVFEFSLLPGRY
jgi:mono/diheme cytochrome c family protein